MPQLEEKKERLTSLLHSLDSVLVAFSGGVDSTYLLAVAVKTLGAENVLAVTSDTESLPRAEKEAAQALAKELGVRHELVSTDEFSRPEFRENNARRCFFCKDSLFKNLRALAEAKKLSHVLHGANADDTGDYRPGMDAARLHGVRAPLLEAELTKADIRELSREMGLRTWNKPALACLSSRIPYGTAVEPEKLRQVEEAESFIRSRGISQVRVRHHGTIARIEVEVVDIPRLIENPVREEIVEHLKKAGFAFIAMDLAGFKSGSLNTILDAAS